MLGRETYLAPVSWVDGWPVVGELALDIPAPAWPLYPAEATPVRDDFDDSGLYPRWVSPRRRSEDDCSTKERPGWLSLDASGGSLDGLDVTFVGRRQQHPSCRVRALVDAGDGCGGLAVRLDERHHYEIEVAGGQVRAVVRIGPLCTVLANAPVPAGPLVLRVETAVEPVNDARGGPDTVSSASKNPTVPSPRSPRSTAGTCPPRSPAASPTG